MSTSTYCPHQHHVHIFTTMVSTFKSRLAAQDGQDVYAQLISGAWIGLKPAGTALCHPVPSPNKLVCEPNGLNN